MVVLDDEGGDPYEFIHEFFEKYQKTNEEVEVGAIQCMKAENINQKWDRGTQLTQYLGNVACKLNGKCRGVNHMFKNPDLMPETAHRRPDPQLRGKWPAGVEPYMVIGADITHNIGTGGWSIAAMVGSLDYHMTDYAHAAVVQPPKDSAGGDKGGRGGTGKNRMSLQG